MCKKINCGEKLQLVLLKIRKHKSNLKKEKYKAVFEMMFDKIRKLRTLEKHQPYMYKRNSIRKHLFFENIFFLNFNPIHFLQLSKTQKITRLYLYRKDRIN